MDGLVVRGVLARARTRWVVFLVGLAFLGLGGGVVAGSSVAARSGAGRLGVGDHHGLSRLAVVRSGSRGAGGWRLRTVVSPHHWVWGSQLAVSENGAAALGWLQGPSPQGCFALRCPRAAHPWHGYRVMLARGTARGGFGAPLELSPHGDGGLFVGQVSSGVTYVAWSAPLKHSRWRIAAIRDGQVGGSTVLPRGAQLQGIFTGRSQQAAAVWLSFTRRGISIHYAFLDPRGHLGRQGSIATVRGSFMSLQLALNDHGELAGAWVQGSRPATVVLALCDASGRCSASKGLGLPKVSFPNVAVTLADDGTASLLAGGHGLWAVVTRIGQSAHRVSKLAGAGDFPIATATGTSGAVAMFNPTGRTLDWTFLKGSAHRFTAPKLAPDHAAIGSPVIAANLAGQFVAVWPHATRNVNPTYQIKASLGKGQQPQAPTIVVPANRNADTPSVHAGIDGQGNLLITWQRFSSHPGNRGLFEATHPN